jgi:homoserine dehydrogenase
VRTRFYLRLVVEDRPGVLAEVAGVLAEHHISIASVIQHEAPDEAEGQRVHLVIMTHTAQTGQFRAACAKLDRLTCLAGPGVHYPVED